MKAFYLIGSIIFTVIILIVAFQNFGTTMNGFTIFFTSIDGASGTVVIFGVALLGIFAGGFYFGFLSSLLKGHQEDEELPGGMS